MFEYNIYDIIDEHCYTYDFDLHDIVNQIIIPSYDIKNHHNMVNSNIANSLLFIEYDGEYGFESYVILPKFVQQISIEDRLTYNLPEDIILTNTAGMLIKNINYEHDFKNLKNIDLNIQLNILRMIYGNNNIKLVN